MVDIDLLKSFVALAVTHSYSQAANELFVTQPTLTRRIKALEGLLGCALVNRTMPITLTHAGEVLLPKIGDVLSAYDELFEAAHNAQGSSKTIAIQDTSHFQLHVDFLSHHTKNYSVKNPSVSFIYEYPPEGMDLRNIVLEGKVDICISGVFGKDQALYLPPDLEGLGIVEMSEICGCLALGVDSGNPILERNSIKLEDCSALRFITPAAKYLDFYRQSFTLMCQQEGGFTPKYKYKPVGNHRFFYSEGPGNCAYMVADSFGGGGYSLLTPAIEATTTKIMFPDIQAFPIAVYNAETADDAVVEFVKNLGRSIR